MTKRIIMIDDNIEFCRSVQSMVMSVLNYRVDYTQSMIDMQNMIRKAELDNDPYDIATIDLNFPVMDSEEEISAGYGIIKMLKRDFPYILCFVLSSEPLSPSKVLIWRDQHDLDFFMNKRSFDPIIFESYIQHILDYRNHQNTPKPAQTGVFISYRRKNTWGKARAIANSLKEYGLDVFLDVDSIGGGAFPKYIIEAIVQRQYFIILLAPETLESEWVQKELRYALDSETTIIPVLLDGFELSTKTVPDEFVRLLAFNGVPITAKTYQGDIERLTQQYLT